VLGGGQVLQRDDALWEGVLHVVLTMCGQKQPPGQDPGICVNDVRDYICRTWVCIGKLNAPPPPFFTSNHLPPYNLPPFHHTCKL
jgi:hypothetical protein